MFTVDLKQQYNNNTRKYDGKVSIASRNITNLWFADDTNALAEEEQKLEVLKSRQELHKVYNGGK